jgi:hypothetical protein
MERDSQKCLYAGHLLLTPVILAIWVTEIRLRPAQANSLWDFISKITRTKWTGGMAKAVECLLCKHKSKSSNFSSIKEKKKCASTRSLSYGSGLLSLTQLSNGSFALWNWTRGIPAPKPVYSVPLGEMADPGDLLLPVGVLLFTCRVVYVHSQIALWFCLVKCKSDSLLLFHLTCCSSDISAGIIPSFSLVFVERLIRFMRNRHHLYQLRSARSLTFYSD